MFMGGVVHLFFIFILATAMRVGMIGIVFRRTAGGMSLMFHPQWLPVEPDVLN
jgi:hypothetical protein